LARALAAPGGSARSALAALALGDFSGAGEVIRQLGASRDAAPQTPGDQPVPGAGTDAGEWVDDDALYLLLLARHLAWTGAIHSLRDEWPRALRAFERRPVSPGKPSAALWSSAIQELALAAESIGEPEMAATFRAEAGGTMMPLNAPGADAAREFDPAVVPEAIVDYYLRELLGVEPDATRNRLVLRPALPEGWDHLDLTQLRFGDAEITLRYRRHGARHHFTLDQESGAVPVRVIFEPLLPARSLAAARVDGEEAVLEPRPRGGRLLVPIQIVLDDQRVIELETAGSAGQGGISLPVRWAMKRMTLPG
jgi:hypothetical protein